jgi:cytochrome c-type biogenesis protein CcmH
MGTLILLAALLGTQPAFPESPADVVSELATVELPEPPLEDPPDAATAAARTDRLQTHLRCPVCQGLSVADSPSDAARAMGTRIEELVSQGYTEDQITYYFVDRYGAWVELEPPDEDHKALFLAPIAVVLVGGFLLLIWGRRERKMGTQTDDSPSQVHTPDPAIEPWRNRILEELGEVN